MTFVFTGFPNLPGNSVQEKVFVHGELVYEGSFSFNGPEGSNTVAITVPAGLGQVDARAKWNTNGFQGGYDISQALNCSDPKFTIEKEQEIAGSGEGWTKSPLVAAVGKTVDYRMIVKNTGNTQLTFSKFTDAQCQNITGGPAGPLAPGESTTYFCEHTLTEADENKSPVYENQAKVTGTPPKGEGPTKTESSNIVIVKFPKPNERPNGEVNATCSSITFTYRKFPNLPNNTVTEKVFIKGELVLTKIFHFNGPSGSDTIPITVPPGLSQVDGRAKWNTNGFQGGWDVSVAVKCSATPAFSIEKTQKIEGSSEGFTSGTLTGEVGQTIDYQVKVTNTGNTSLTFSEFSDAKCTGIAGGPAGPLAAGQSATYTCSHKLEAADGGHSYENTAGVAATPPPEQGSTFNHNSNTVVVNVPFNPEPAFTIEKLQRVGGAGEFTTLTLTANKGETIEYEIVLKDTGNTPLSYSTPSDPNCTGMTLASGPSEPQPNETTVYTCSHEADEEDVIVGHYENIATETATPPQGDGGPVVHESNAVLVKVEAGNQ